MITERIQIDYRLHFTSAFRFGTGLRQGLIHRVVARNDDDYLYMPGSTFKGVLRERCEQLADLFELEVIDPHAEDLAEVHSNLAIVNRIFGSRFQPGQLYFDDAQLIDEQQDWFESRSDDWRVRERKRAEYRSWQTERRTQVSISRLTRTAKPGHLYNSEYGVKGLTFEGSIYGLLTGFSLAEKEPGTYSLLLLLAGLSSLDLARIGGNKSTGAGHFKIDITEVTVDRKSLEPQVLLNKLDELEYYQIVQQV